MEIGRMSLEEKVQLLLDRAQIEECIYRYASATDDKDWLRLRQLMEDDVLAEYAGHELVRGADAVIKFIQNATATVIWGHHKLSVAHIEFEGSVARTLTYHTSHSVIDGELDTVIVKVARYRDTLRRQSDGTWRFSHKVLEAGWDESRVAVQRDSFRAAAHKRTGSRP